MRVSYSTKVQVLLYALFVNALVSVTAAARWSSAVGDTTFFTDPYTYQTNAPVDIPTRDGAVLFSHSYDPKSVQPDGPFGLGFFPNIHECSAITGKCYRIRHNTLTGATVVIDNYGHRVRAPYPGDLVINAY